MEILFENLKGRMKMKKRGSWYYNRKVVEIVSNKPSLKGVCINFNSRVFAQSQRHPSYLFL
ncbi:hypothetical protein Bca4012_014885 [Brassica carinata]